MNKHEEFINFSLGELISKSLSILEFEVINSKEIFNLGPDSNPHFFDLIKVFETEKQKINYWKLYATEIRKSMQRAESSSIQSKSNHVYLLAIFERYRTSLLNHAYNSSKKCKDQYREFTTSMAKNEKDGVKQKQLLITIAENPDNLIKYVDNLFGKQWELERNMFGLRTLDEEIFLQEVLSNYIVSREIRNLLVHRSEKSDSKLYSGIKNGTGGTIFSKDTKNLSSLLAKKGYLSLFKLEIGKIIRVDVITILYLVLDILYLSFHMTSNAINKKYSSSLDNMLGQFINDMLCIYFSEKMNEKIKKIFISELVKHVDSLYYSARNKVEFKSDLLIVNYIVLKKQFKEAIPSAKKILSGEKLNDYFSEIRIKQADVENQVKDLLKLIENKKIKNIIRSYYNNDDLNFIKAIKDYNAKQELHSWSMIRDKIRSSGLVKDYLESGDKKNWEVFKESLSKNEAKEN
jgi:F0F1-type ATP synthase delta subunit